MKRTSKIKVARGIPEHVERVLTANRRSFLKSAGLFAVTFGVDAGVLLTAADAQTASQAGAAGPYPDVE